MTQSNFFWFMAGIFVAELVGMLTTTTPTKASQNLRDWWSLIFRRR